MNASFYILFGIGAGLWLAGIAACVLAFRWSGRADRGRFWPSVILAIVALLIGYVGLTRYSISASKTVNGQVQWRFDSKWFFIGLLAAGVVALVCALWRGKRTSV